MKESKGKSILILVIIIVIAVGALFWFVPRSNVHPVTLGQIPKSLPQDIILDPKAEGINGYTATTPDGSKQSTVSYTSTENPQILVSKYLDYFFKNGWKVDPTYIVNQIHNADHDLVNEDKQYLLNSSKANSTINVVIVLDPVKAVWVTSITLLQK